MRKEVTKPSNGRKQQSAAGQRAKRLSVSYLISLFEILHQAITRQRTYIKVTGAIHYRFKNTNAYVQ